MKFDINKNLFLKDPRDSELGLRLLNTGLIMIDTMGLENFTFRKLAAQINSTEASIYRYFENKHKFLVFLSNWYWSWLAYRIMINNQSFNTATDRLKNTLSFLASPIQRDDDFAYIDEEKLHRIIVAEGPKAYHTKEIDSENKDGFFLAYKKLCKTVSDYILAVNPNYTYSHSLASTIIETCQSQIFFSQHLPRLTDIEDKDANQLEQFIYHFTFSAISK